ncbi:MAG: peptide chain release factor 1 [Myxococcota bacterium]
MNEQLAKLERRFHEVTEQMSDPETASDPKRLADLGKERSKLEPVVSLYQRYRQASSDLAGAKELLGADDDQLKEMAKAEVKDLEATLAELQAQLELELLPKDPLDDKGVVLEIRAGAGGDEAALFAGELYSLYERFASAQGWRVEVLSSSPGTAGGFKEIISTVEGDQVYAQLKFEGGVHRVQRVPATESQGRVHTSTVTVAVMPEVEEQDFELDMNELRIDVFRAGGHGGQSVNTTDSAVRVVHLPSNTIVICQDEKSQHKNKAKALKVLRARLSEAERERQAKEVTDQRRSMVGSGDRSEKIRTYNFPQDRISDHRINLTLHNLPRIMQGDLQPLVTALRNHAQAELLQRQRDDDGPQ